MIFKERYDMCVDMCVGTGCHEEVIYHSHAAGAMYDMCVGTGCDKECYGEDDVL